METLLDFLHRIKCYNHLVQHYEKHKTCCSIAQLHKVVYNARQNLATLKKILGNDKAFQREKLSFISWALSSPNTKLRQCGLVVYIKLNIVLGVGRGR